MPDTPKTWTCEHCGRVFNSHGGLYYHRMQRRNRGECPPTQEVSRRQGRGQHGRRKKPKDPLTADDLAWIRIHWT